MKKALYLLFLISALIISSCSDNPVNNTIITATKGVYILSEGTMSPGSGKLSYYDSAKDTFHINILNQGSFGLFPDGIVSNSGYLYITEQGNYNSAGTIYKTDLNGTVLEQKQVGTNPYSLCYENGKFYITNGPAGNVSVLDGNMNFVKDIQAGVYPQEIVSASGRVYVCNTSVYGGPYDSTITVIDANSNEVLKTLRVDRDPSSLAITNDGKLIAGCPGIGGRIFIFDTFGYSLSDTLTSPYGFSKDISPDKLSKDVYFIGYAGDIIKLNLDTRVFTKFIEAPAGTSYIYGYAYDVVNSAHYVLDAKNFSTSGTFSIYNASGQLQKAFTAGVAPRRILIYK
ncbi:MAG: YncE family protein [Ignavibacteria bacterium]